MITGLYTCMADSIPMICITGQALKARSPQGGLPGGRHRRDRQAGGQEDLLRQGGRPDPAGLPRGVPHRPRGPAGPGADRPAAGRTAGRGGVRPRHRRTPGGLQAVARRPQDQAGDGDAPQGRAADPDDGRRGDAGPGQPAVRRAGRVPADPGHPDLHGRGGHRLRPSALSAGVSGCRPTRGAATSCSWSPTWCSPSATDSPSGTPAIWPSIAASASSSTSTSSRR